MKKITVTLAALATAGMCTSCTELGGAAKSTSPTVAPEIAEVAEIKVAKPEAVKPKVEAPKVAKPEVVKPKVEKVEAAKPKAAEVKEAAVEATKPEMPKETKQPVKAVEGDAKADEKPAAAPDETKPKAAEGQAKANGDWPGWGGDDSRNMVNEIETNMPTEWDVESGKNIKWSAELGSQSYGNPTVYQGKVYVGTNNEGKRDPGVDGDKGNIMCFNEADGKFLWQAIHDKLPAGRVNDWPLQGICSTPWVEGDRLWYVNNRCELVCADTEGFLDGKNDGMQDEIYTGDDKADLIWTFDMIEELAVFPHNLATSSVYVKGDLVFLVSGNGVDEGHLNLPSPDASAFLAFNKVTGELVWEYFEVGRVLHGQWSSPAHGVVNGVEMTLMPGGDGVLYALNPANGELIWKFNLNPADSVWELGGYGTRNNLIATPVFHDGHVYLGVGQDPEHGSGIGHFFKIDASGKGDVTETAAKWHIGNKDFGRTMSSAAVKDGLVYICDLEGYLYCLDDETGEIVWKDDLTAATWGSPMVIDGKVYIGDEDGDIRIVKHGREKELINEITMDASVYTTPTAANGVLYVATKSKLYAIANEK